MKAVLIVLIFPALVLAQGKTGSKVESKTYHPAQQVKGPTTLLKALVVTTRAHDETSDTHPDEEELLIVKEGGLKVSLADSQQVVGPGSVIYIMPGEEHGIANAGAPPCKYYVIRYKSNTPRSVDRLPSFIMNWNDMKFVAHDKGGRRDVINEPTMAFERFEMHVTTLNPGLPSHDPHTHIPEEIILVKEGTVEMRLDDRKVKASTGDWIFIDSKILHGLTNIGTTPATYYAFQWN